MCLWRGRRLHLGDESTEVGGGAAEMARGAAEMAHPALSRASLTLLSSWLVKSSS